MPGNDHCCLCVLTMQATSAVTCPICLPMVVRLCCKATGGQDQGQAVDKVEGIDAV
jgi:hypothetical protein